MYVYGIIIALTLNSSAAVALLLPDGIIRPIVSDSALTWFNRYIPWYLCLEFTGPTYFIKTMVNLCPGIGNLSIYPIRCLYTSYILSLDNSRTHKYVTMDTATYQLEETVSDISQSE